MNYQQAMSIGENRAKLKKRLLAAKSVLSNRYKLQFTTCEFDFEGKRLVGDTLVLQWKVRRDPNRPISYENQQTNEGVVALI